MASYTVNITSLSSFPWFTVSPSSLTINNGDTVVFANSGSSVINMLVENFDAGEWNSTSLLSVPIGTSGSRVATVGSGDDTLNFFHYYGGSKRSFAYNIFFGTTGTSLIPFNHATGALPFSEIISFFAGAPVSYIYTPPTDLGSFYRGGTTVPNITQNNAIPTSGAIAFSNFRNAYTNMYFVDTPDSKTGIKNTIPSGGQVVVAWYAFDTPWGTPADWQMGYSPYIKWAAEYQYSLTITSFVVNAGGYTVYPRLTAATPTTWTAASGWSTAGQVGFGVEMYVNQNSEIFCQGYVTMQVRHPQNTGYTLSVNVPFVLNAFGP